MAGRVEFRQNELAENFSVHETGGTKVIEVPMGYSVGESDGMYVVTHEESGEQFFLDADGNGIPDEVPEDEDEPYDSMEEDVGEEDPADSDVGPMAMISESEEKQKLRQMREHMPVGISGKDKALEPDHDFSWKDTASNVGHKAANTGAAALEGFRTARQSRAGQMAGRALRKGRAGAGRVASNVAKNSVIEAGSYGSQGREHSWGHARVDSMFSTQSSRGNGQSEMFGFGNRQTAPSDVLSGFGGAGKAVDNLFGFGRNNHQDNPFGFGGAGKSNPFEGSPMSRINRGDNPFGFGNKGKKLL